MDANGTRFHLLEGGRDWRPAVRTELADGLEWHDPKAFLRLQARPFLFPEPPGTTERLAPADRRGAAVDRYGNIYWIGADEAEVRVLGSGARSAERFWSPGMAAAEAGAEPGAFRAKPATAPPAVGRLRGLAVTSHHYLVVGVVEPAGLLIFDLHAGGPPLHILWPDAVPFAPFDIAAAANGGVHVLDRSEPVRYWTLDRHFRVVAEGQESEELAPGRTDIFHDKGEEPETRPPRTFPTGIVLEAGSPLTGIDAIAIAGLPDGTVLVLEYARSGPDDFTVHRYRFAEHLGSVAAKPLLTDLFESADAAARLSTIDSYDMALAGVELDADGRRFTGRLFIAGNDGNQAFAFDLTAARYRPGEAIAAEDALRLEAETAYYPMAYFSGKGLIGDGSSVYYDYGERWAELMVLPRRRFHTDGHLVTPAFDGGEPGCVWHRVFLEGVIPAGSAVQVETAATDDADLLEALNHLYARDTDGDWTDALARAYVDGLDWQLEPAPYRRAGSDVPSRTQAAGNRATAGTWETLIQASRGRYLAVRLTLTGSGAETPCLANLRVTYPRFSYLDRYLPGIYREDAGSADFLERYLAITEGLFTAIEDRIAAAQILFDVDTTPPEYLDWLAGWFGIGLDAGWDEDRRRLMLRHLPQIFRSRGTVLGLIRALRLATDPAPTDCLFELDLGRQDRFDGFQVRIREDWVDRTRPGIDPYADSAPADGTWSPLDGPAPLNDRFAAWLDEVYAGAAGDRERLWGEGPVSLPATEPADPVAAADWRAFLERGLAFTYAPVVADARTRAAWQAFLKRRYGFVGDLNSAYQLPVWLRYARFTDIALPAHLPAGLAPLRDWIRFVSAVAPAVLSAHRFTVQLPVDRTGRAAGPDPETVRRIVSQEKPAHTAFSIEEYWSMFRVGDARLGLDTVIDEGTRVPPLQLGRHALGHARLGAEHPFDVKERFVVGRDRVRAAQHQTTEQGG